MPAIAPSELKNSELKEKYDDPQRSGIKPPKVEPSIMPIQTARFLSILEI
jgi:hypothetical protein